ncbi:cytochrome c oxidase subunit 3 family protein [bacterium]|jgi:cytochrome c oxidase subunit 3|nr:cytochrome c oxidase subunit 3 family protein [bacterium]
MSQATVTHHHAHHFASADDEFEAAKQGMWVFLVTEVLMFGGLFVAYGTFRGMYPEMFHEAHKMLSVPMGALNTVFLITSSLTMAMAVTSAQKGLRSRTTGFLAATFLLAGCFLVVKYFEYMHKIHDGLLPAGFFTNHELTNPKAPLFFSLYFVMTGLHGVHVLIGMGLIAWIMIKNQKGYFSPAFYTPVELVGFYWHFVDLVWIYLFPLLYLVS